MPTKKRKGDAMKKTVWTEKDIADLKNHLAKMGMDSDNVHRVLIDDESKEGTFRARQRMSQDEIDAYLESQRNKGEK